MTASFDDLLPDYVLGTLDPGLLPELEQQLARSPALCREVDALTEALVAGVVPLLTPVAPRPAARARLLAALEGPRRFAPFSATLARMCDLSTGAVDALLAKVDDATAWLTGYAPGLSYFNFPPGPRFAGAAPAYDAGFVKLQPGARFPRHRHVGHELTLILAGRMRDGDRVFGPGDVIEKSQDSEHDYATEGPEPLILVSLHRGLVPV